MGRIFVLSVVKKLFFTATSSAYPNKAKGGGGEERNKERIDFLQLFSTSSASACIAELRKKMLGGILLLLADDGRLRNDHEGIFFNVVEIVLPEAEDAALIWDRTR